MSGGYTLNYYEDKGAPVVVGAAPQRLIVAKPADGPRTGFLWLDIHGSGGQAGSNLSLAKGNDPVYRTDMNAWHRNLLAAAGCGITMAWHDLWSIDNVAVPPVMEPSGFGDPLILGIIDTMRTYWAPFLGCRSDRIIISGESQGSLDALYYTLLFPENVEACFAIAASGDIEMARFGNFRRQINRTHGRPDNETFQLAAFPQGPLLRSQGPDGKLGTFWAPGVNYRTYDTVFDGSGAVNQYGTTGYYCTTAHLSAAPFPGEGNLWKALDPLAIRWAIPEDAIPGTSLMHIAKFTDPRNGRQIFIPSELQHQPAHMHDAVNILRFRKIVDGSLIGRRVPIWFLLSAGDTVADTVTLTGVADSGVWMANQIGAEIHQVSDGTANHGGEIQPMDPQFQVAESLNALNQTSAAQPIPANQEAVYILSGNWIGTLTAQISKDNGVTWSTVPIPVASTTLSAAAHFRKSVNFRATANNWTAGTGAGTEGPAISAVVRTATSDTNGVYRFDSLFGITHVRLKATAWTSGQVDIVRSTAHPDDFEASDRPVMEMIHLVHELSYSD